MWCDWNRKYAGHRNSPGCSTCCTDFKGSVINEICSILTLKSKKEASHYSFWVAILHFIPGSGRGPWKYTTINILSWIYNELKTMQIKLSHFFFRKIHRVSKWCYGHIYTMAMYLQKLKENRNTVRCFKKFKCR